MKFVYNKGMKKINILLLSILLLSGCSKTPKKDTFNNNIHYEHSIANTQKLTLSKDKRTKAQVILTYLNMLEPDSYKNEDAFIVSFYTSDDNNELKNNTQYSISHHTKATANTFKKLSSNDPLMKYIPSYNAWSNYYLLTFPSVNTQTTITLTFASKDDGKAHAVFKKDTLSNTPQMF